MLEVKVDGKFILDQDISHEEFIHKLMMGLRSVGISFVGSTIDITEDKVKIYGK